MLLCPRAIRSSRRTLWSLATARKHLMMLERSFRHDAQSVKIEGSLIEGSLGIRHLRDCSCFFLTLSSN
ncbi:hypothetical protein LshimejAT787_1203790 [Lyophyllum shimeji]|uniref:Uncharacterized protein n=1 Tax=Lyophyllum shimeji TaxID=47721 RepID=A0A9P3PU45_LYOSH|nr:hypothetical protein LshimejAT787_1203790 [Lyophyllum shimeji]